MLVGHPLDLIKVKLQAGNQYSGIMDVARSTLKQEGAVGFYRGVSAPLLGVTPIFAVCFWGYDMGQKVVRQVRNKPAEEQLTLFDQMIAGALSAVPATVSSSAHCVAMSDTNAIKAADTP